MSKKNRSLTDTLQLQSLSRTPSIEGSGQRTPLRTLRFSVALMLSLIALMGCEEDPPPPPPPNLPVLLDGQALCERRMGDYYLTEVSLLVQDYDGIDTLLAPSAELLSIALPLEPNPIPAPPPEEEEARREMLAEMAAGDDEITEEPICMVESCQVRYVWRQSNDEDSAPILCGADGKDVLISIRVMDQDGHSDVADIRSRGE
jgi:hypothetical protein